MLHSMRSTPARDHLWCTGLLVLLLGASACEYFRGYVREARLPAAPPEGCVRASLGEVPGITVYAQGRSDRGFWFNWEADQRVLGSLTVDRKGSEAVLGLHTGRLNSCVPAALARGRAIMGSLYERLRVNCPGLPEPGLITEERIGACD